MNLDYAVDRLYESGWAPVFGNARQYETLADGRRYPATESIYHEFEDAGLKLAIKHNLVFDTYRATWGPTSELADSTPAREARRFGTVIGSSEQEAAVYALAQLRESQGLVRVDMAHA